MNKINKLIFALLTSCLFLGCVTQEEHNYFDDFKKIQVDDDFYYYHYTTKNASSNTPLVVSLTGYNAFKGGADHTFCSIVAKYMNDNGIEGTIISPYVYYVGDFTENFNKIKKIIDSIQHNTRQLYLVGGSMGATQSLKYCQKWNAAAVIPIAAGNPIDTSIDPSMTDGPNYSFGPAEDFEGVSIFFLNGAFPTPYKDGRVYLSDGVVWVNPILNLYWNIKSKDFFSEYKYIDYTMYGKEYDHGYILVKDTTPLNHKNVLRWLFMQKKPKDN